MHYKVIQRFSLPGRPKLSAALSFAVFAMPRIGVVGEQLTGWTSREEARDASAALAAGFPLSELDVETREREIREVYAATIRELGSELNPRLRVRRIA